MIVLDTNVLSELMRPQPDAGVLRWLDAEASNQFWITSITVAEILASIARLPDGKRKTALGELANTMFDEDFAGRILAFDHPSASHYAQLAARREHAGKPISMADAQIAAMCKNTPSGTPAALATRNGKDFVDLDLLVINPWALQ